MKNNNYSRANLLVILKDFSNKQNKSSKSIKDFNKKLNLLEWNILYIEYNPEKNNVIISILYNIINVKSYIIWTYDFNNKNIDITADNIDLFLKNKSLIYNFEIKDKEEIPINEFYLFDL